MDGWNLSIIRRSLFLLALVVPGLLLNFGLSVVVAEYFSAQVFGLFYLGMSVAAVIAAPSAVIAFYLARYYGECQKRFGDEAVWALARTSFRRYGLYFIVASLILCAIAFPMARLADIGSPLLIGVVVILATSTYLIDAVRGILQACQRFLFLGSFGLSWMAGRFALGLGAIWVTGKVWAGLLGVSASAMLAALAFYLFLVFRKEVSVVPDMGAAGLRLKTQVPFALGYSFAFIIAYSDIIIGYLIMDKVALGVYSASSVLPKGIYTLTMPIMQVMFPIIVSNEGEETRRETVRRALLMTLALTVMGGLVLWVGSNQICGGWFSLGSCESGTVALLAISIPAISLLRGLVLMQLAKGGEMHSLLLFFPLAVFVGYELTLGPGSFGLAGDFAVFTLATLVFYALACLFIKPVKCQFS